MANNWMNYLPKNRWLKLALVSLIGILLIGLLQGLFQSLFPTGTQGSQMSGMGMMGPGMGMGQGMMGAGMGMGMMGGGMGMMGGMSGSSSGSLLGSFLGFIFNAFSILAVIALFAGVIGFIYNYVRKNILPNPKAKTEPNHVTKAETTEASVNP